MSGGSLNYVYKHVSEAADMVEAQAHTSLHRAFAAHLVKVSRALHDLEWVWSFDKGPGDEEEAIRAIISPVLELEAEIERAREVMDDLRKLLDRAGQVSH